jgi:hypothetical protein
MSMLLARLTPFRVIVALVVLAATPSAAHSQPTFVFDYSFDTNGFFNDPARRTALETAGQMLTSRFTDTLTGITPGGSNAWMALFIHPGTGADQLVNNLVVPQNTILVYAGGRAMAGSLGRGGPGGFQGLTGSQQFVTTVIARGQTGALASTPTDFGPWGGAISFNTGTNWNFSVGSPPTINQFDFLSVAIHELGHLLGFGLAESFDRLINASLRFTGPVATGLFGNTVPISSDRGHWAEGTMFGGQASGMDPFLSNGERTLFNELDFAGLDDLGWQVTPVPEPGTLLLCGAGMAGVVVIRRRRRAA